MALYESEHTKFMRDMMTRHPEWAADQLTGRALLWDRKIDPIEQQHLRETRELEQAYPYDVNFPAVGAELTVAPEV
jgi:hypothetical protein